MKSPHTLTRRIVVAMLAGIANPGQSFDAGSVEAATRPPYSTSPAP